MYQNLIQLLNPKPTFNLEYYNGEDSYSEGEIEDIIIDIIANNEPENYTSAIYDKFSWSTYYHLTHLRKNILNWYPFEKDSNVLEIGCGMGAITSVLCDSCKHVTSVELSRKRATATLLRCREKDNLEIIVGNLNDIEFKEKYDYITLIGVFEYQGTYTASDNPYVDFLRKVKGLLKPNGKLLIAIENQYGLKYWCGAREDHTAIPFDGINQYTYSDGKVRTFSKNTLDEIIKKSGFKNTYFYYPMPDYKLPTVVYSQDYLPKNENMMNLQPYYAPDNSTLLVREDKVYKDIIDNKVFEFFANSFLVECTNDNIDENKRITFASLSSERLQEYRIATRFVGKNKVEKLPLEKTKHIQHIHQIYDNEHKLKENGLLLVDSEIHDNILEYDFCNEILAEDVLLEAYNNKDKESIYEFIENVYKEILKSSEHVEYDKNILYMLYPDTEKNEEKYGPILKVGNIDLILRNAFYKDDKFIWFDQEWILENVPAKFILYRLIKEFYIEYPYINNYISLNELAEYFDLLVAWKDFEKIEGLFINSVADSKHSQESNYFRNVKPDIYTGNIKNICK